MEGGDEEEEWRKRRKSTIYAWRVTVSCSEFETGQTISCIHWREFQQFV
jgi:hypothetical protein